MTQVQRFDVVLVALDPTIGSEIQKTRPCLVVSPDEMNRRHRTIIIAPLTSSASRVPIRFQGKRGQVALDQLRAIDRTRIVRHLGAADRSTGSAAARKLVELFVET